MIVGLTPRIYPIRLWKNINMLYVTMTTQFSTGILSNLQSDVIFPFTALADCFFKKDVVFIS